MKNEDSRPAAYLPDAFSPPRKSQGCQWHQSPLAAYHQCTGIPLAKLRKVSMDKELRESEETTFAISFAKTRVIKVLTQGKTAVRFETTGSAVQCLVPTFPAPFGLAEMKGG